MNDLTARKSPRALQLGLEYPFDTAAAYRSTCPGIRCIYEQSLGFQPPVVFIHQIQHVRQDALVYVGASACVAFSDLEAV
jgi:hypothetical protein